MAELFDVCDENGCPTGEVVERSVAHRDWIPHRTAHVWITRIFNGKQQALFTQNMNCRSMAPCSGTMSMSRFLYMTRLWK